MKLPRWLVIGMLTASVLAMLAIAGWWWVTWPERTAMKYAELLMHGRVKEWAELWSPESSRWDAERLYLRLFHNFHENVRAPNGGEYGPVQLKRTAPALGDFLVAAGDYEITREIRWSGKPTVQVTYRFRIERGSVNVRRSDMPEGDF